MNDLTDKEISALGALFAKHPKLRALLLTFAGLGAVATGTVVVTDPQPEPVPTPEPVAVFYPLQDCIDAANEFPTKPERQEKRTACRVAADPETKLITEEDMAIIVNDGNPIRPGETVTVTADAANEWVDGTDVPGVSLQDPADPGHTVTLPVVETDDPADKTITMPGDNGGMGFTEPGAPAVAVIVHDPVAAPSSPDLYPGTNIRWRRAIGSRIGAINRWSDITPTWLADAYVESGLKEVRELAPAAFASARAEIVMNIKWRNFYTNENVGPSSRAEAQDPDSDIYIWNTDDRIAQQLADPLVTSDELGLRVLLQMESSSIRNTHPLWMIAQGDAAYWEEGGGTKRYRTKPDFFYQTADAIVAFVKKYGNSGLSAILLGEYYIGQNVPTDVNQSEFLNRRREIWEHVAANVPLDEDGNQIAILQKSFVKTSSMGPEALINNKIGYSQSDIRTFGFSATTEAMQGNMPTDIGGDLRFAEYWRDGQARGLTTIPTPAPPNPFGWTGGESVEMHPDVVLWFASYIPNNAALDSIFLRLNNSTVQNAANFAAALRDYGDGGDEIDANHRVIPAVR